MQILFIAVCSNYYRGNAEFLGMELLASSLEANGYTCRIVNFIYIPEHIDESIDEFIQNTDWTDIGLVGFCPFFSTFNVIEKLCSKMRECKIDTYNVVGGGAVHPAAETLKYLSNIDAVLMGESEQTIVVLTQTLEKGVSLRECEGIAFRSAGEIIINNHGPLINDLDQIPWARRDVLNFVKPQSLRIQTARGCEGNCTFCAESHVFEKDRKKNWRGRSPKNIVDEFENIVLNHGINSFSIVDSSFEDPISSHGAERMEEIVDEILHRELDINFEALMRAESIAKINECVWRKLKKSGLVSVLLGIESGSDSALKLYGKKATKKDNETAFYYLNSIIGINVIAGFIMFNPYTTTNELEENIDFLQKSGVSYSFRAYVHEVNLFHGTPLLEKVRSDGLLNESFSICNPIGYEFVDSQTKLAYNRVKQVEALLIAEANAFFTVDYLHQTNIDIVKTEKNDTDMITEECKAIMTRAKNLLGEKNHLLFREVMLNNKRRIDDYTNEITELIETNQKVIKQCNHIQKLLIQNGKKK